MNYRLFLMCSFLAIPCVSSAQVASGGSYTLEQQVVAGGGGSSSEANYAIDGTIGQSIAGTFSMAGDYGLRGGFWQPLFGTTAAHVSITGRVVAPNGAGIGGVRLVLIDGGGVAGQSISNPFGYFQFHDVEVGQTYILSASGKRYRFPAPAITVDDAISDLRLVGLL
jgi:hypothetical protein